ncbi:MAG: hypothetical protein IKS33_08375 [Bacteroidales bacterium]|jgi:hypothetical protein|nr:hypothetical protein [Bacteroidales bacterium]
MKKIMLVCTALLAFVATASAQSSLRNRNASNDTLFLFVYENDSVYITSNDVKSQKNGKYFLTAEKFFQLDNIHVQLGHCCVSLYEKSPLGIWERIWVQHPWDNILPPGRKLWIDLKESFITTDGVHFFKVVTRKGASGYFKIIN